MNAQAREPTPASNRPRQFGRYRVLTQLGQGGMGAIHLAVTADLEAFEKLVVIKELRQELSRSPDLVSLFLSEMKLAAHLNHPNIVHTLEAGHVGDRYFMSMEFLDGQSFAKVIARQSPVRLRLQILCEALAGLHYAHELKDYDGTPLSVVHCDVSFGNVFVTYDGQVKLVDFGVARVAESLSRSSGFQGKVRYAAPEQLTGGPIDRRADVFAAGIMLWELLAMRRYTAGLKSDREIVEARLTRAEPKLIQVLPTVDRELAAICDRALALDPAQRFATAQDFRAALSQYLTKLGAAVDASEISRFMKAEFASEQARVHQLISSQMRRDSGPAAPVTLERTPGHEDVTTVADLSTLIESISSKSIPIVVPRKPDTSKQTLLKVFAGTCLLVVAAFFLLRGRAEDAAPAGDPGSLPLASASSATSALAPTPALAANPTLAARTEAPQPSAAQGTSDPASAAKAANTADSIELEGHARDSDSSSRRQNAKSERVAPTDDQPPSRAGSVTPPSESGKRAPANRDVFDQELGPRPKTEREGIDAENPFK